MQIRKLNEDEQEINELIQAAKGNKDAQLITSIPGFSYFSSLLIAAEIGDIRRFASSSKLVSWAGVCSRVYQSGNTIRHSKMKKDSNCKVNWVVLQCALVAVRHDARLAAVYERACTQHPKKVALTHVGNKIVKIIWHMLTYRKPYVHHDPNMHKNKSQEREHGTGHASDENLLAVQV